MERQQYVCPKCGNMEYEADQFQGDRRQFCQAVRRTEQALHHHHLHPCGYTELYKEMSDGAMDVLDFLIGG